MSYACVMIGMQPALRYGMNATHTNKGVANMICVVCEETTVEIAGNCTCNQCLDDAHEQIDDEYIVELDR